MQIGQKINLLRKNAGITQEQLAQQLHVSRQTISKWEAGTSLPDIESVIGISRVFGLSLDDLLLENDRETADIDDSARNQSEILGETLESGNGVSFKSLEELVKMNRRNRIVVLLVTVILVLGAGIVLGGILDNKLANTTLKMEYSLYQYMELAGRATALVDTNAKNEVLLVADGTYDDGAGKLAAIVCDVYYSVNNKVKPLGTIASGGTAYPIAVDRTGIYTASGHSVERFIVDEVTNELVLAEAVNEIYDNDGNVTYEKEVAGVKTVSNEEEFMELFEDYAKAITVSFQ